MTRRLRHPIRQRDDYPELIEYRDEGCDLAPACLSCPFDVCRYDMRSGQPSRVPRTVIEEQRVGASRHELATKYRVTTRQISRILAKARLAKQEVEAC